TSAVLVPSTPALDHRPSQRSSRIGLVEPDQRLPPGHLIGPLVALGPGRRPRRRTRPSAPLGERTGGGLRAAVRAPQAEVALVRSAIERGLRPNRLGVVCAPPPQDT